MIVTPATVPSHHYPKIKVEQKSKEFIRLFRKSLKRQFNDLHKRRHYTWNNRALRLKSKIFYLEHLECPSITPALYKLQESLFFSLIHPNFKPSKDDTWFKKSNKLSLVFGQHPSKANMCIFFSQVVVQILWAQNYANSREF